MKKKDLEKILGLALLGISPIVFFYYREDLYKAERDMLGIQKNKKNIENIKTNEK